MTLQGILSLLHLLVGGNLPPGIGSANEVDTLHLGKLRVPR